MQPMMLLAVRVHYWLTVSLLSTRTPQVFTCNVAFQLVSPQYVLVREVIPPQGQEFILHFVGLYEASLCPLRSL